MLISIVNLIFSPFCLILFFFIAFSEESSYFESTNSTNVTRLKPLPYVIYTVIYVVLVLSIIYMWSLYSYEAFDIWEVFIPKYYWVSVPVWIITGYTVFLYFKGMEGNIMGFIFFPLLIFSSLIIIGINVTDLFSFNWKLNTDLPVLQCTSWIRLVLHVFLPTYVLLLIQTDKKENKWLLTIVTIIILQLILFGVHWFVIKLFGESLTFSEFFGEEQTIFYYIPMIFGFLHFVLYYLSQSKIFYKNYMFTIGLKITTLITRIMIILQIINYYHFIRVYI